MTQKKVVILVLGALVVVTAFLLLRSSGDEICQNRTITFDWKDPKKPGEGEIYAKPEHLDDVRDCASVVVVNLTNEKIEIVFDKNTTGFISPFSEIKTISLEPTGDPNEFAKPFSVTVKLSPDNKSMEFPYHVELDGAPQTEQSPRIRIGPKSVIGSNLLQPDGTD